MCDKSVVESNIIINLFITSYHVFYLFLFTSLFHNALTLDIGIKTIRFVFFNQSWIRIHSGSLLRRLSNNLRLYHESRDKMSHAAFTQIWVCVGCSHCCRLVYVHASVHHIVGLDSYRLAAIWWLTFFCLR